MCGDMLSSAWESEQRQYNVIDFSNPKNAWMIPEVKEQIEKFQNSQVEQEFSDAVEEHRIEEVYWVGGEPLMYEQHWRYMQRIIELGDGPNVYARYNTNLSRVNYRGINLWRDILSRLRDWQVCASIDGTGRIGEYIRTGLNFDTWLKNFREGVAIQRSSRQVRMDFTLTTPGLFEVQKIQSLAQELGVEVLAKVVFSFSPDIVMSPLALPRELLDPWVDEILNSIDKGALHDILVQLKTRPTFAEQWPAEYEAGLRKGKAKILELEKIRQDTYTMQDILAERPAVLKWWNSIEN
jgi:sulfatase maturation enzyme AslB (radical SAM superfamily)